MDDNPVGRLREALLGTFDREQLLGLCAAMGLPDEGMEDESREELVLRLTGHASRRGRVSDLIARACEVQPGPVWDEVSVPREVHTRASLRHQLPALVQGFVGRGDDLRRAGELLEVKPLGAVIYGRGGAGKSSFAVHLAHRMVDRYPDAQVVMQMHGRSGRSLTHVDAARRVIHTFEPQWKLPDDNQKVLRLYQEVLAERPTLILLDDTASADEVAPIVPPTGSALLITSRQPLSVPGLNLVHLGALSVDQARDLLVDTAGAAVDPQDLDRITALCGRLPLALRIAGALLAAHPDWTSSFLARELTEERVRLASLRLEDAEVESALTLAAGQLGLEWPELAARWQLLSLFPAPFDLIAAAAVWNTKDHETLDDLSRLVARGLVLYDPKAGLYDLHGLVRPAAEDALSYTETDSADDGEPLQRLVERARARLGWDPTGRRLARAVARHANHYLAVGALASERYLAGSEHAVEGLRMFDAAWPHLREARDRMRERNDRAAARWVSDFARHVAPLLGQRLPPRHRIPILEGGVAAATQIGDRRSQASHLGNLGLAYADMGEPQRAIAYHQQALSLSGRLRDRQAEGAQWTRLGDTYQKLDEPEQAIKCHQSALDIHQGMGDRRAEGANLAALAVAYKSLGDAHQAISYYGRALTVSRETGDRRAEGAHLGNLGQAYRQLGDTERAIEYFEQALAIARRTGDLSRESAALGNLGLAHASLGDVRRAQACHRQALAIARRAGGLREQEIHLGNLGIACASLGQRERAIAYLQEALAISRQLADRRGEAQLSWSLGLLVEWTDPLRAVQLMRVLVELSEEEGDPGAERLKERLLIVEARAQKRSNDRRSRRPF